MFSRIASFPGVKKYHLKILKLMTYCNQIKCNFNEYPCFIIKCETGGKLISMMYNPDFYDEVYIKPVKTDESSTYIRECGTQKLVGKFNKPISEDLFELLHETAVSDARSHDPVDLSEFDFDNNCFDQISSISDISHKRKTPVVVKTIITSDGFVSIIPIKLVIECTKVTVFNDEYIRLKTKDNRTLYISSHSEYHSKIINEKRNGNIVNEEDLLHISNKSARK